MSRIFAFVLRAGGAVGGAFAGLRMPPDVLINLLADAGVGAEAGLTPAMATVALATLGAIFGFLLGSALAGVLPDEVAAPLGTREEAAASVPRLRRHLGDNQVHSRRGGTPLERLSAPPAGQQLPKHDLSHIPPAPRDDEITFERIPNTGFYADIESPVQFDVDDDDLARFAAREEGPVSDAASKPFGVDQKDAGWDYPSEVPVQEPGQPSLRPRFEAPELDSSRETEAADAIDTEFAGQDVSDHSRFIEEAFEDVSDTQPVETPAPRVPGVSRLHAVEDPEPASATIHSMHRDLGHDGHSAPRFAPGLTGGMEADWFAGEADEEEDADDDGAGYGSLMAIGLGKTHKPRAQIANHRPGEANLTPMPLLDAERDRGNIPNGAGPQDFRLREALEELKRV